MPDKVPERVGKCKILRRVGHGATAVVYLARHEGLDMPVAVKILRKELSETRPHFAERFLREARMAARLEHPNMVRVIDCGVENDFHYMVMDYVDGPNCREQLTDEPNGIHWRKATDTIDQAAKGLAYAAERNVIHRDVKPSNIMIDSLGRVRVSDLGLAKLSIKGRVQMTQELHTVGTPNYMSPEQIRSSTDLDLRSDIYSLGATFYHLVTGKPPFLGKTSMEVISHHLGSPLVPPSELRSDLPPALSSIICKMMAKSPEERYPDYESLRQDLQNVLEGKQTAAEGFSESQVGIESEDEVRRVLDELSFSAVLTVEDKDELGFDEAKAVGAPEEQAESSTELDLFGPEEFATYDEGEPGPRLRTRPARRRRKPGKQNVGLIIGLVAAGVVVVIAIIIIAVLASG